MSIKDYIDLTSKLVPDIKKECHIHNKPFIIYCRRVRKHLCETCLSEEEKDDTHLCKHFQLSQIELPNIDDFKQNMYKAKQFLDKLEPQANSEILKINKYIVHLLILITNTYIPNNYNALRNILNNPIDKTPELKEGTTNSSFNSNSILNFEKRLNIVYTIQVIIAK